MSWFVLYLRSRRVAAGAGVAVACAVGFRLSAGDNEHVRLMLAVFVVTAVCAVTSPGLAGQDPALERTAALDWRGRRAAHVAAIGVLAVVLGVTAGPPVAAEVVVRAAVGLAGLTALGVTLLGGSLAWCVPVAWSVIAMSVSLAGRPVAAPLVTWLLQPVGTAAATAAAGVLGVAGLLVYAVRGPKT